MARRTNPAVALYRHWDRILAFSDLNSISYGHPGWYLWRMQSDVIAFGQYGCAHFAVSRNGHFMLGRMWGYHRRTLVARHVGFLDWGSHWSATWADALTQSDGRSWWVTGTTGGRVPESLLCHNRHYYGPTPAWCRLVTEETADGPQWRIVPSRFRGTKEGYAAAVRRWAHHQSVIEKRRRRRACNEPKKKPSVRIPTVRTGGQELPTVQAVQRLAALMETEQPAKSTPLRRRLKEAHDGNNLDPQDPVREAAGVAAR